MLKDYELDLGSIYNKLYLRPMSEVRLQGYISLNMKVTENKLGYIVVPNDIICEYEVDSASAGNMVNEFNFIKEVLVWATITEDIKNNSNLLENSNINPIKFTIINYYSIIYCINTNSTIISISFINRFKYIIKTLRR